MHTKPVTVSIRVGEENKKDDDDSSQSENSDTSGSNSESDNSVSSVSSDSDSGSDSESSSSESSSSSNSEADDDLLNREQLLDKLDDLQDVLEEHADEAMERQDKHMPLPVMCEQVLDAVLAWNDTLAQCLRVMRPCDDAGQQTSDMDSDKDQEKKSDTSSSETEGSGESDAETACSLPVLITLNLDAQPARRPDLTNEFQVARGKCAQYSDAKVQCDTLTDSHDMLLQCQKTEDQLTRDKMDNDVFTMQEALKELQTHHTDALAAQAEERDAMNESLARCQSEMPSTRLAVETVELASILKALPDWVPQRQLWMGQAGNPCTDREILVIAQHIIRLGTPLDAKAWSTLVSDLETQLQRVDKLTDDMRVKMRSLEDSAGALRIPRALVQRTRQLVDTVRAQAARRGELRAKLENDMFVIRKVHTDQIDTLARSFVSTKTKLCDAAGVVIGNNQNKWQLAIAKLMNACVHPLLEMTMPLSEARLSPRALVAYQRMKEIGERDIDAQRMVRVEALVRHALTYLPELQRVAHEYAALVTAPDPSTVGLDQIDNKKTKSPGKGVSETKPKGAKPDTAQVKTGSGAQKETGSQVKTGLGAQPEVKTVAVKKSREVKTNQGSVSQKK